MSRIKTFLSGEWAPIRLGFLARTLTLLVLLLVLTMAGVLSQAQSNFTVIHTFTGPDGANPESISTLGTQRNLYGTTQYGGTAGYGVVYELAHRDSSWILNLLYSFKGGSDGAYPEAGVTFGPDGTLFGVTAGGGASGFGTLFNLKPPAHLVCPAARCPWTVKILHSFGGGSDGYWPLGNVVFDSQGNLYGTTYKGGDYDFGTVYKATLLGGTWNVSVIYSFGAYDGDGTYPTTDVVLDSAGNIYGTTATGGAAGYGTIFELSPSQGAWTETILHSFAGYEHEEDGWYPRGGLTFDRAGNLYGGTFGVYGTIFQLSPQGGGWNFTTLYTFPGYGPLSTLVIDSESNLYGAVTGGTGTGNAFELSPSGGGWTYTDLYDFSGGSDGQGPNGVAVTGPDGYLYGTTYSGGANGRGVIYQINLGAFGLH